VYPPCYRPGDGYKVVYSVLQAKKVALKMGPGAECWRWTRTKGRKDEQFLASRSSSDFEFEVVCD
jgi:hypothetical protein